MFWIVLYHVFVLVARFNRDQKSNLNVKSQQVEKEEKGKVHVHENHHVQGSSYTSVVQG